MKVNEIFLSLQGESLSSGLPTVFVRFTGCNLRCTYCDTTYSYEEGIEMEVNEILEEIKKYECKRICLTGGEPLLQKDLQALLDFLENYEVSIETNGSVDISSFHLYQKHRFVMDIKCPSSGMSSCNLLKNIEFLTEKDEVKFVISDYEDFLYSKDIIESFNLEKKVSNVIMSPVYQNLNPQILADWILKNKLFNVRLGLQLHKILWGEKRGI